MKKGGILYLLLFALISFGAMGTPSDISAEIASEAAEAAAQTNPEFSTAHFYNHYGAEYASSTSVRLAEYRRSNTPLRLMIKGTTGLEDFVISKRLQDATYINTAAFSHSYTNSRLHLLSRLNI